ncbi:MAG: 50S ribosomal protein L19 [bacterium]|nr:50S ribosomal protein L19 [bacterium]
MQNLQIREGQSVQVFQKVVDGKRERNVAFTGKVLKVRGIGINKSITVKQLLDGIEVERIFPLGSPTISEIKIIEEKEKKTKKRSKKRSKK